MKERRTQERRNLIYYFRVLDRNTDQLLGYAANISAEGVMLVGRKPTTPAANYRLRMILPVDIEGKKHVEFEATSRWCRENGDPDYFESGFQLNSAVADDLAIIERIGSAHALKSKKKLTSKRLVDIISASFGLFLLSPIFLAIGTAIKLDTVGPIFFIARRVGKFGRPFRMYKFRTMTEPSGSNGPQVTAHDDPRVTRVGHLLRKTKLNELPQLFNVLKGEMSLVGPRPEYLEFVEHYSPEHRKVLSVKPGITSLASILYADEEKMLQFSDVTETYVQKILPDKLRLDLLYVRNRSLLLDVDILVQTMVVLIPRFRKAAPRVEEIGIAPFRLARQHLPWFVVDASIAFIAVILAGGIWRSAGSISMDLGRALTSAVIMTAIFSISNWLTGTQRVYWRYASAAEAIDVVVSASAATIVALVANSLSPPPRLPAEMLILSGIFALIGFLVARYNRHLLKGLDAKIKRMLAGSTAGRERVLVVGAGDAGQQTISLLRNNPAGRAFNVVGVVDDDLDLLGTLVHRVPVLGVCEHIPEIVREKEVGTVVFAIHSIEESSRDHLMRLCKESGVRTVFVPDLLGSIRQSAQWRGEDQVVRLSTEGDSQAERAAEGTLAEIQDQIRMLAEKARRGDFPDVAESFDRLDRILEVEESTKIAEPPAGLQPRPGYGHEDSP